MENNIDVSATHNENKSSTELKAICFKPLKFIGPPFSLIIFTMFFGIGGWAIAATLAGNTSSACYSVIIGMVLFLIAFALRFLTWKEYSPKIEFSEDSICIPRWDGSRGKHNLPYEALKSVDIRGGNRRKILVIGTLKKTYFFPLKSIVQNEDEIKQRFKHAILNAKNGENLWAVIHDSQKHASILMQFKAPATIVLTLLMFFIFGVSKLFGYGNGFLDLVQLGGNAPILVKLGQMDRLLTSNFLHLGLIHLYFNAFVLFIIGSILEKMIGWKNFLLVFLLSSVGAAVASFLAERALVSVGASGAIFGLMGSLLLINIKMGFRLPAGFNLGARAWIVMFVVNCGIPFVIPLIDWVAHLGGFIAGMLSTWVLLRNKLTKIESTENQLKRWRTVGTPTTIVCWALIGVFLLSFTLRIVIIANQNNDFDVLLPEITARADRSASLLNEYAWAIVTSRNRSDASLELAQKLMQPVVDEIESLDAGPRFSQYSEYLDTYAVSLFLQGKHIDALLYEYKASEMSSNPYYASQISRFLEAINKESGVWLRGSVQIDDFTVRESEGEISLFRSGDLVPVLVTVQVRHSGVREGYFECEFVDKIEQLTMTSKSSLFDVNRDDLTFDIVAIDSARVSESVQSTCNSFEVDGEDDIKPKSFLENLF